MCACSGPNLMRFTVEKGLCVCVFGREILMCACLLGTKSSLCVLGLCVVVCACLSSVCNFSEGLSVCACVFVIFGLDFVCFGSMYVCVWMGQGLLVNAIKASCLEECVYVCVWVDVCACAFGIF